MHVIYARNTEVRSITSEESQSFVEAHHRQGSASLGEGKNYSIGLYRENALVAVAQFCQPRTSRMANRYSFELLRMAFHSGVRIPGGASKLIAYFIAQHRPADFFTYQDMTGEATAVYELAGMTLVDRGTRKKQYLVAPNRTLQTASRKEALGMAYATRYGPDRILGTKLGEIFRPNGKRKSNRDIFLEELGWHIEETAGDRVYEWVDPNRTYYTYKITASDSEKYYYGVSHVKLKDASMEECSMDGYMGSGGLKFSNWMRIHRDSAKKEIIATYRRRKDAFAAEGSLVGDLYKTDPNCLNSTAGGKDAGLIAEIKIELKRCDSHGLVAHYGESCYSCLAQNRYVLAECPIHGITIHSGESCVQCYMQRSFTTKICEIHGETIFHGDSCRACSVLGSVSVKECDTHGLTKHIGKRCYSCIAEESDVFSKRECEVHGRSTFRGDNCTSCLTLGAFELEECAIHGLVQHQKGKCMSCRAQKSVYLMDCDIHGKVKTQNGTCSKCAAAKRFFKDECAIHGESTHRRSSGECIRCEAAKRKAPAQPEVS